MVSPFPFFKDHPVATLNKRGLIIAYRVQLVCSAREKRIDPDGLNFGLEQGAPLHFVL